MNSLVNSSYKSDDRGISPRLSKIKIWEIVIVLVGLKSDPVIHLM